MVIIFSLSSSQKPCLISLPTLQFLKTQLESYFSPEKTSLVAQTVKHLPTMRKPRFSPWVGKVSWRRKWQPTPVSLPGKSHSQRSLVGYSPWVAKSWTRLNDFTSLHFSPEIFSDYSSFLDYSMNL